MGTPSELSLTTGSDISIQARSSVYRGAGGAWIFLTIVFADTWGSPRVAGVVCAGVVALAILISRYLASSLRVGASALNRRIPAVYAPKTGLFLKISGAALLGAAISSVQDFAVPRDLERLANAASGFTVLLYLPAIVLVVLGHRLRQRPAQEADIPSDGNVVLWLRGFEDDGRTTLNPPSIAASVGLDPIPVSALGYFAHCHPLRVLRLLMGVARDTAEEQMAAALVPEWRLVCLGRPGEWLGRSGAERVTVPNDRWQEVITRAFETCAAIVLQPATTDSLNWELNEALTNHAEKTLLCIPPIRHKSDVQARLALTLRVSDLQILTDPEYPVLMCFRDGMPIRLPNQFFEPTSWPFRGCALDVRSMLQPFLGRLHDPSLLVVGGEGERFSFLSLRFIRIVWALVAIISSAVVAKTLSPVRAEVNALRLTWEERSYRNHTAASLWVKGRDSSSAVTLRSGWLAKSNDQDVQTATYSHYAFVLITAWDTGAPGVNGQAENLPPIERGKFRCERQRGTGAAGVVHYEQCVDGKRQVFIWGRASSLPFRRAIKLLDEAVLELQ